MIGLLNKYGFTEHVIIVLLFIKYLERKILILFGSLVPSIDHAPKKRWIGPAPPMTSLDVTFVHARSHRTFYIVIFTIVVIWGY